MFIDITNRNCSLVQKLTIKMPSYTSTADFEMPRRLRIKITEKNSNTAREKKHGALTLRRLMSYTYIYIYIYAAPILDVSRSHTTTQHSR